MKLCLARLLPILYLPLTACDSKAQDIPPALDTLSYYSNPLFEPTFADPTLVKADDGWFYAYATEDFWDGKDHLIPVIRSKNLTQWNFIGDAFLVKPSWKDGGLWAPDIFAFAGRFYLFYSFSLWGDPNPGVGMAVSDVPQGPFTDLGKFFLSTEVNVPNSIDPFVFHDPVTDSLYIFWGSFHGIYGQNLSFSGDRFHLTGNKFRIAGSTFEGSYLYYRDSWYYFFGSSGSCCEGKNSTYHVRVGRSRSPRGPFTDDQGTGLLSSSGAPGKLLIQADPWPDGFAGPGHNGEILTDDKGQDWFFYHAINKENPFLPNGATRRPMMMERLKWLDGWPKIDYAQPSKGERPAPWFRSHAQ